MTLLIQQQQAMSMLNLNIAEWISIRFGPLPNSECLIALLDHDGFQEKVDNRLLAFTKRAQKNSHNKKIIDKAFTDAIKANPKSKIMHLRYAQYLDMLDRNAEAVVVLKQVVSKRPYNPLIACQYAWALTNIATSQSQFDEAKRWIEIAHSFSPQNFCLVDTEAWIEFKQGHIKEALDHILKIVSYTDKVPEIAYHFGKIHLAQGNRKEAYKFLKLSLSISRPFAGYGDAKLLTEKLKQDKYF